MTSAISELLVRRGLAHPTYEHKKISKEDEQIEKLAKAIGKEFAAALAKSKASEALNAFLAEIRVFEATRYNTNNVVHCHQCYENALALQRHADGSHVASRGSNSSLAYDDSSASYHSANRSFRSEGSINSYHSVVDEFANQGSVSSVFTRDFRRMSSIRGYRN